MENTQGRIYDFERKGGEGIKKFNNEFVFHRGNAYTFCLKCMMKTWPYMSLFLCASCFGHSRKNKDKYIKRKEDQTKRMVNSINRQSFFYRIPENFEQQQNECSFALPNGGNIIYFTFNLDRPGTLIATNFNVEDPILPITNDFFTISSWQFCCVKIQNSSIRAVSYLTLPLPLIRMFNSNISQQPYLSKADMVNKSQGCAVIHRYLLRRRLHYFLPLEVVDEILSYNLNYCHHCGTWKHCSLYMKVESSNYKNRDFRIVFES